LVGLETGSRSLNSLDFIEINGIITTVADQSKNADIKTWALIGAAVYFLVFFVGNLLLHWRSMPIIKNIEISGLLSVSFAGFMYVVKRKDWFD
jgi:hypothetical protein